MRFSPFIVRVQSNDQRHLDNFNMHEMHRRIKKEREPPRKTVCNILPGRAGKLEEIAGQTFSSITGIFLHGG
jgi:hypothetical protein